MSQPAEVLAPPPPHEAFTSYSLGRYLDSPAGQALIAAHRGDRHAAANALAAQEMADERWRRDQAQLMYDRNPARYPSGVGEAMARVGRPPATGIHLAGTSAELEAMGRRGDPRSGVFRVVAPEAGDTTVAVGTRLDSYGRVVDEPELTQAPWQKGG